MIYKVKHPNSNYYDVYEGTRRLTLPEFKKRGLNIDHIPARSSVIRPVSTSRPAPARRVVSTPKVNTQDYYKVLHPNSNYYDVYDKSGRHIPLSEFKNLGLNITQIPVKQTPNVDLSKVSTPVPQVKYQTPPQAKSAIQEVKTTPVENIPLSKSGNYVKVGQDVYNASTGEHIDLPTFKKLGLNYQFIPEATPEQMRAIGVSNQKTGLLNKITGLLKNEPTFDYQKAMTDMATSLGIPDIQKKLTDQLTKVQAIQNQIDQLEAQKQIEIQNNYQRQASMETIERANEAVNRKYDQEIALLSMKKAGEAAIAKLYQGDRDEAEQLLNQGIKAGLIDYEQKVHRFNTLLSVYGNWYNSLNATERQIIDNAYRDAQLQYREQATQKQNVAKLMLTPAGAQAGVSLTDDYQTALGKVQNWLKAHPNTTISGVSHGGTTENIPSTVGTLAQMYLNGEKLSSTQKPKAIQAINQIVSQSPVAQTIWQIRPAIVNKIKMILNSGKGGQVDIGKIKRDLFNRLVKDYPGEAGPLQSEIDKWFATLIPTNYLEKVVVDNAPKNFTGDLNSVIVDSGWNEDIPQSQLQPIKQNAEFEWNLEKGAKSTLGFLDKPLEAIGNLSGFLGSKLRQKLPPSKISGWLKGLIGK